MKLFSLCHQPVKGFMGPILQLFYSSVEAASTDWAIQGVFFPLVLSQVCWCCSVNFYSVHICECKYLKKKKYWNLGIAVPVPCKVKGSPTTALTMAVENVWGRTTRRVLPQDSLSLTCFERALPCFGVPMSFIATKGLWFLPNPCLNLVVILTLCSNKFYLWFSYLVWKKKNFPWFHLFLFFFIFNLQSIVLLIFPRYCGRWKWFSHICFSTEFMILYLLSSVVFSMLKSARPSNFSWNESH